MGATLAGRLTIIGGGVMGLMTACQAAPPGEAVTVLDRSRVGDPAPWAGRVLAQLALRRGTGYDIRRFTPARFAAHEEEMA